MNNKTHKPLVSIIIPVHNPGVFLADCLRSVLGQAYENIEVIIINDDSTDDSESTIKQFQTVDPRIRYYKTLQHNAARSRREGIKKSSAQYICFVDSDDVVDKRYVEVLYNALVDGGTKISTGKICSFVDDKSLGYKKGDTNNLSLKKDLVQYFIDNYESREGSRYISQSINAKMYDKSLLDAIDYSVIKTSVLEDNYIMPQILKNAAGQKIAMVDSTIYYYRQNPHSTMSTVMDRGIKYNGKEISYPELFNTTLDYIQGSFAGHKEIEAFVCKMKIKEFYNMALNVSRKNERIDLLEAFKEGLIESIGELRQDIDDHKAVIKKIRNSHTYKAGLVLTAPFKFARRAVRSIRLRIKR